jgi:hypothetical protein
MSRESITEYPSYYTIIPSYIRYNKNLSYFEMILYSEIVALSNKFGFSFASNSYFAKVFNKSSKSISRSINKMVELKLLRAEIDKEGGNTRKLYINLYENNDLLMEETKHNQKEDPIDKNVHTSIDKNVHTPMDKSVNTPMDKNVHHNIIKETNIIKDNNINNNMSIRAGSNNTHVKQQPLNPFFKKRTKAHMNKEKINSKQKTDVRIDWLQDYMDELNITPN